MLFWFPLPKIILILLRAAVPQFNHILMWKQRILFLCQPALFWPILNVYFDVATLIYDSFLRSTLYLVVSSLLSFDFTFYLIILHSYSLLMMDNIEFLCLHVYIILFHLYGLICILKDDCAYLVLLWCYTVFRCLSYKWSWHEICWCQPMTKCFVHNYYLISVIRTL